MPAPRCSRGQGYSRLPSTTRSSPIGRPTRAAPRTTWASATCSLRRGRPTGSSSHSRSVSSTDSRPGFFALVGVYYFQDPETFGLSAGAAGATLALFFVPFAVLQAPFGSLSDRVGRFLPVVLGSIAYGIVTIGVGVAPVYPVAAALMVLVGVCGALMAPATMALVTDLVEPEARGAAMGLFNVFGSLGFLAGFLIGGSATDLFGYTPAFLAVGGLELAIALALFPAVRSIAPGDGLLGLGGGTGRSPSE